MSLTIPKAGVVAGRAPALQEQGGVNAGDLMAAAGDAALAIGTSLENDRLSREAQRLQVDMSKDFNDLRLEVQKVGSPDQIDAVWQNGTAALRQKYLEGQHEDGRPYVDPKNQERFGLAFDELNNRHGYTVGAAALQARQSEREGTWVEFQHQAGNAAALSTDPEMRNVIFARSDAMLADMVASNTITAEEAAKRRLALRSDVSNASAIEVVSNDPRGFLIAAENGDYADLGAEAVARYTVRANAAIAAADAAAEKEVERAQTEATNAIGSQLKDYQAIFDAGRVVVDEAFLSRPDVQAHPEFAKTQAALGLSLEIPDLPQKSPAELMALIADEKNRPVTKPFETERLPVLEAQLDKARAGWSGDPIAYAATVGMPVPELPEFDANNPRAFSAALGQRQAFSQQLVQSGYVQNARALTDAERAQINDLANPSHSPEDRVALASAILPALRGVGVDNANEIVTDRVFLHVGEQIARGTIDRSVAVEAFRGQQVIEEGNVVLPPVADRTEATFQTVQDLFGRLPGGEKLQSSIVQTADAIYAARVRITDPTADIDEDLYRQSFHEAMGGSGQFDGRNAMGGVQNFNGKPTIMPRGINADAVDDAIGFLATEGNMSDGLLDRTAEGGVGAIMRASKPEIATQRLTAISMSGKPPIIGGKPATQEDLADAELFAVGDDRYIFVFQTAAGQRAVYDEDGEPYQFSLMGLLREVNR